MLFPKGAAICRLLLQSADVSVINRLQSGSVSCQHFMSFLPTRVKLNSPESGRQVGMTEAAFLGVLSNQLETIPQELLPGLMTWAVSNTTSLTTGLLDLQWWGIQWPFFGWLVCTDLIPDLTGKRVMMLFSNMATAPKVLSSREAVCDCPAEAHLFL